MDCADAIGGTLKWKNPPGKDLTATAELWDTYDRLVDRVAPAMDSGQFQFHPVRHPLSRTYRILAKVMENGFVVDQKERWVGMPSNEVDDFQFLMWASRLRHAVEPDFHASVPAVWRDGLL